MCRRNSEHGQCQTYGAVQQVNSGESRVGSRVVIWPPSYYASSSRALPSCSNTRVVECSVSVSLVVGFCWLVGMQDLFFIVKLSLSTEIGKGIAQFYTLLYIVFFCIVHQVLGTLKLNVFSLLISRFIICSLVVVGQFWCKHLITAGPRTVVRSYEAAGNHQGRVPCYFML